MGQQSHHPAPGAGGRTPAAERININTASHTELTRLPGVDDELADRIIRFRSEHGPIRRLEELQEIPEIGSAWRQYDPRDQITF